MQFRGRSQRERERAAEEARALSRRADRLGDFIAAAAFEARADKIDEVGASDHPAENQFSVDLVFHGRPVRDSAFIEADFGADALHKFLNLLHVTCLANTDQKKLGERGPLRPTGAPSVFISGLVRGSFGFSLTEQVTTQSEAVPTANREAWMMLSRHLRTITSASDDDFETELDGIDGRVFGSLKSFVKLLVKNDSTVEVSDRMSTERLTADKLAIAHQRLQASQVRQKKYSHNVVVIGLAPRTRTVEFKFDRSSELMVGKLSSQISSDYIERIERERPRLGGEFSAVIVEKTVTRSDGDPRTTYQFLDITDSGDLGSGEIII